MPSEYGVAMTARTDGELRDHLIRTDGQEDLAFALWTPSTGATRTTALINSLLLPEIGERSVHGNVSFNPQYVERVCQTALERGFGIAFLHSHPFPGWQGMSPDDVAAEERLARTVFSVTGLPLVGLTVGTDGSWSARFWMHQEGRTYRRVWASSVRTVGTQLGVTFADRLIPRPEFRDEFRRTVSVWGSDAHARIARLRFGIVGLGSVGAIIAESLARMGMTRFALIDFDSVEAHNLDRLVTATREDIGRLKVDVARERIERIATAANVEVRAVPFSVVEEPGYRAALDCDVIFSCVDRPRARHIMNHFAYAHLIPVIDGGIGVRFRRGSYTGVDWQVQTVGPGRPCLECLGAYDQGDVSTEAAGKLDDPAYMQGLPDSHHLKRNENVFPFSANLASLEIMQLIALTTGAGGIEDYGLQRYRSNPGVLELTKTSRCKDYCDQEKLVALGDSLFNLIARDLTAEQSRSIG